MAVSKFPVEFPLIKGGSVLVTKVEEDKFHFHFVITDRNGKTEVLKWIPSVQEIRENRVIKKQGYSDLHYRALASFWAIFND